MATTTIFSWNVNGIRASYKKGFNSWLEEISPDIMCIQETKAQEEQLSPEILKIKGYRSYFTSPQKKGYSGVAIYSKFEPISVEFSLGVEEFDNEGRMITLEFNDFYLSNVYFPNGKSSKERLKYKLDFYNSFLEYITKINFKKPVIFCGDVNTAHREIDLARPKQNEDKSGFLPVEREWIDKIIEEGYIDTFRLFNSEPGNYTWWDLKTRARDRNVGWRIDYFFVNSQLKDNIKNAYIMPEVNGSDHCPIGLDVQGLIK
ncbi:exodeoxyribonuclease III [Methanosalsum natronophilum]|uniref:Exodeoxyribonuclease III n=1 Tax=Methanosalsum natronophilum TaxID=768733 RepID=A0A3R7VYI8_9EURY|nr:exodeoxyribonuclease III [Methanosalsum natronophilum]MCS3924931.1 exodeoxyribonuclease-3 [Methanosalsum natronophilum]RQD86981.1 MAG: exodeoxyribonuclease III [Methanosalsum natronophilum]